MQYCNLNNAIYKTSLYANATLYIFQSSRSIPNHCHHQKTTPHYTSTMNLKNAAATFTPS
jgi:hypothetical protein